MDKVRYRVLCVLACLPAGFAACADDDTSSLPLADAALGNTGMSDGSVADAVAPSADVAADGLAPIDTVDARPMPDVATGFSFFVGPAGRDSNPGTAAEPLLTLSAAAAKAGMGDTIWLLDGTFNQANQTTGTLTNCDGIPAVEIASGVTVRPVTPGMVVLKPQGWGVLCLRGATVRDIDFDGPPGGGVLLSVKAGNNVVEGSTFSNGFCSGGSGWEAAIMVRDAATLTMLPGRTPNFMGTAGCTFMTTWATSSVTFKGGAVMGGAPSGTSGNGLFIARDASSLTFEGTTLSTAMHDHGIALTHTSKLTITAGSTLAGFKGAAILARAENHVVTIANSTIRNNTSGMHLPYGFGGTVTATISDSVFSSNGYAILEGYGHTLNLTAVRSRFVNNSVTGLELTTGVVDIRDSELSANAMHGLLVQPQNVCSVTMRNTKVMGNGMRGLFFYCNAMGAANLGTLASPGGNTFSGNGVNVASGVALMPIDAIGNTWTPSQQGADAQGLYAAAGAGAVLEVTGGSGPNYELGAVKMRLAANP